MNKPRTKKLKRWKHTPPKNSEGGAFSLALNNPEYTQSLGIIISMWPLIEDHMIQVFQSLLSSGPIESHIPARQIYKSIVNAKTRIDIMRNLLEHTPQNAQKGKAYDELLDEFENLNRLRNKYAHALWLTNIKDKEVYIVEYSTDEMWLMGRRKVDLQELHDVIERMKSLQIKIFTFMRDERIKYIEALNSENKPNAPNSQEKQ